MVSLKKDFESIYKRYYHMIYGFCLKLCGYDSNLAEELTQNTFYKAIAAADSFRGESDVKSWLCRIAKNDYISYLRKERHIVVTEDQLYNLPDEAPSIQSRMETAESARQIYEIMENLESPYGEVFRMRVLGEMKFSEIAGYYGKTENWARVIFYRAKQKIFLVVEQEGKYEF